MIPVGNWEETNDELRNEIAGLEEDLAELDNINADLIKENEHLQSALNAADTDIADYLFELDHLREEHGELKQDVEGLLLLVEYWQGQAQQEWERANDLETSSISIDESRELTDRVMDLESQNEDMFWENNRLLAELRAAEQEVETLQSEKRRQAITNLTIDGESLENYVRVNELTKELDVMTGAKTFWMNTANRHLDELTELKSALRTLGGEKEN